MSQYFHKETINGFTYEVQIGWDEPLQRYYMVIDREGSLSDEPEYSNLLDDDAISTNVDLLYFVEIALEKFGITIPKEIQLKVREDEAKNRKSIEKSFDELLVNEPGMQDALNSLREKISKTTKSTNDTSDSIKNLLDRLNHNEV